MELILRLTNKPGRLRVRYPSGRRLNPTGRLGQFMEADLQFAPFVDVPNGPLIVLDPRGIIEDENGNVLYTPRRVPAWRRAAWVNAWLAEHPEWGVEA